MTKKNKKTLLTLLIITLFGFILRIGGICSNPPSLNWDEVSHGYNAYSLLKTGADEWGASWPLIFRAFGDYKLPSYIYLTIPFVALFGLTALSIRLVSVLAGTLAIPLIFLLVKELFPKKELEFGKFKFSFAVLSAFLLAINPWHFFISRPALEANLSLTFIIAGILFLFKGLKKSGFLIPATLFLGLSLHTYNTARVFVPLLVLLFLFVYRKQIKFSKSFALATVLFLLFVTPVIFQIFSGTGTARYQKLNILSESAVFQIGERRTSSILPLPLAKLIHNRPVFFTGTIVKNYFSYFSPTFFNQVKGVQSQFAVPSSNLLTFTGMVLFFVGLFFILSNLNSKKNKFLFGWLLLSPLAAALTIDPPQALRPNPMIPVIIIMISLAVIRLANLFEKKQKIITVITLLFLLIASFTKFLVVEYWGNYPKQYSQSWQYGYQQVFEYWEENKDKFDKLFITKRRGEPHIFYAFYTALDPRILQSYEGNIRFKQSDWFWTDKIGNIYFINDWQIPEEKIDSLPLESGGEISTKKSLLITSPQRIPDNANILRTINFLDDTAAFVITELP